MQPENTKLAHGVAENLMRAGQFDQALELFQKLAADDPRNVPARLAMGDIYRVKHDFAKAHEVLAQAKAVDTSSLEVRYSEVRLLEAESKYTEAISSLNAILSETAKKSYSANE